MRFARRSLLLLVGLAVAAPVRGQEPPRDTVQAGAAAGVPEPVHRAPEWPVLGLAAGALVALPFDESIARELGAPNVQRAAVLGGLADGFRIYGFPGTVVLAASLYAVGRIEDDAGVAAMGLRGIEAIAAAQTLTVAAKLMVGRNRPHVDPDDPFRLRFGGGFRGDEHRSWPSGHTSAAFALAAAITAESRYCCAERTALIAPVLFGGALLAGLSRMYEAKHWTSDVLAGAAGGTLAGLRVVRHHRERPGGLLDEWLLPQAIVPTGDGVVLLWAFSVR